MLRSAPSGEPPAGGAGIAGVPVAGGAGSARVPPAGGPVRPVVSVAEMRQADASAAALDPAASKRLVERAGAAVARRAVVMLGGAYGRRVVVVAGKGNNGADGRVAASRLRRLGVRVAVVNASEHLSGDGPAPAVGPCDLVIDAAYGTGFRGHYAAPATGGVPVLAVDIPSGIDGDTGAGEEGAVRALATVTFAALKPGLLLGLGRQRAGAVEVVDIGLAIPPAALHLVEDGDVAAWLPERPRESHKWQIAVWIVAGSPGMRGAASLCTRAAQRAGAGMVRVGSPGLHASEHPSGEAVARTLAANEWDDDLLGDLERFKALVVGPGLGRSPATAEAVRRVVAGASVPVVVDADGLNALGNADAVAALLASRSPSAPGVILTPHDGEFARLAGHPPGNDRVGAARALARRTGAVVLLKGSTTVVAEPGGEVLLSAAGDARLATAGTGDVLSGVVGALLASGLDPLRAGALAAHLHGRAASFGPRRGLVAGDLPDLLPVAMSAATEVVVPHP